MSTIYGGGGGDDGDDDNGDDDGDYLSEMRRPRGELSHDMLLVFAS